MVPLIELNMIDFNKIKWHADSSSAEEEEDLGDFKEVEGHYKVMAFLIQHYPTEYNKDWLRSNCPVLLSEEDSLKHILDHKQLISDITEDLGLNEASADEICA